ncbi:DUF84 family protein [Brevibacillus daliensis]|uniref:DUF84 family protein n=1 Tax=Brevibacillus daliensis TaxID=2892995 RepID=UPI001E516B85|nr:inosine/xanthosine triphosphatase [Brevibacillus daliensis]
MFSSIVLGSKNKAKLESVRSATGVEPICVQVPSGVSEQPLFEEETIHGAIQRAKNAFAAVPDSEIGLGLEGGLAFDSQFTQQWYLISVCAAWNGKDLYIGKGLSFPIPNKIGEAMRTPGRELRNVIDELSGTTGSNHQGGAYSFFTNGRITRSQIFELAVTAALTPFQSRYYRK